MSVYDLFLSIVLIDKLIVKVKEYYYLVLVIMDKNVFYGVVEFY